jgi:hypothetical protein
MLRKVLALLVKSLRDDVRLLRYHMLRLLLAIIVLLVLWQVLENQYAFSAPGLQFFEALTVCNLLAITLAGATLFSTAITEEREEQTLALMKMADVGPLAILLGKWLPRMLMAALMLSVQIPFTLLAITMGGVLWSQIVAVNWMLFAYLFLLGNVGLFASVWSFYAGQAFAITAVVTAVLALGGPILSEVASNLRTPWLANLLEPVASFLSSINPFLRFGLITRPGFDGSGFTWQVGMSLFLGLVLFLGSWLSFNFATALEPSGRSLQMQVADLGKWFLSLGRRRRDGSPAPISTGQRLRYDRDRRRVWQFPLIYKDFYQFCGGPFGMALRVMLYGLLCVGIWSIFLIGGAFRRGSLEAIHVLGVITAFCSLWFLGIEATLIAVRVFRTEIKDRTWGTLALLPRSVPEMAYAKLLGASLGLLPALTFLVGGTILGFPELLREFQYFRFDDLLAVTFFTLQVLAGVQVAMFVSVALDFAAWPVSIAIGAITMATETAMMVSCIIGLLDFNGRTGDRIIFVLGSMIACLLILVLHVLTLVRLKTAMATEG